MFPMFLKFPNLTPCERLEGKTAELLDLEGEGGGLTAAERESLRAHSRLCHRCAELLKTYRRTVELLRALPRREAPADFLGWICAAMRKH